jgi:quercetin dioxygenase-like cupin family protein
MTESSQNHEKHDTGRADLLGKVFILKDLVQYQNATVASRMIVNRKSGSITIFSFDETESLSEHTAPFDAVVTILEGSCEVRVGGTPHQLNEGDTIIFPANVPHALSAITKFKMMLIMIRE